MNTLYRQRENHIGITLKQSGNPVSLNPGDQVEWALADSRGKPLDYAWHYCDESVKGANWAKGIVVPVIDTTLKPDLYADRKEVLLIVRWKNNGQHVERLRVLNQMELESSQLFIKDVAVAEMRDNQLLVAASGAMREVKLTDDYIWQKLRAAESEIAHKLRILLTPHQVFPNEPTADEIAALNGMPYLVETPYDYSPHMYDRDKWGYFVTRQRPIISVQRLRFVLPSQDSQYFDIPLDWLKLDEKYGHVRLLPSTNASLVTSSMLGFTALTWQSIIPNMLNLTYQAGIKDAWEDYPELIDAIKKMAVVKIITDLFLPQSGSISADGLSESMSTDVTKYQEQIDHIINGQDGNGGLMAMFNGIRAIVI
ncbi:hypothetical protein NAD41_000864 [Salmonella enterica]|nr:hypothetical protein [Salmonella enterica]EKK6596248.1 hypothetical protein [Salmonella enterica]